VRLVAPCALRARNVDKIAHVPTARRRHFGSVRRLPSGRFQASYWHEGTRHVAGDTFASKADALAWLSRAEADISRGSWVDPSAGKLTVAEVVERWLGSNVNKRASSRLRDESIMRTHVLPVIGGRQVARVTRADVQALVDRWATESAASSVGRMFSALRAVFSFAVASELVVRSPCVGARLPKSGLVDRPVLTAEQLQGLAEALGPDEAPMMWLGVVGGLRWAECAGLTVPALDLLAGTVSVSQQLGRDGTLGVPKSRAGIRRLAIPDWLVEDIAGLLSRRGLTAADGKVLVFVSPDGQPLHYSNWRRRTWVPACEAADLAGLRFHDLRSMAATALVAAGVDVKTAQTRLGHSSPSITLGIYARATAAGDRAAAEAVGQYLRGEPGAKHSATSRAPRPMRTTPSANSFAPIGRQRAAVRSAASARATRARPTEP
jgi:integrase